MKIHSLFIYIKIGFLYLLITSGIGRDDVRLSKYEQFGEKSVFDCVGEIYYNKEFQQSCILIDSTHILTSAHAFYLDSGSYHLDSLYIEENKRWIFGNVAEKQIIGRPEEYYIKIAGEKYALSTIVMHETYKNAKPYHDENGVHASKDFDFDIAIAELETPVKGIPSPILHQGTDELHQRAIMAGYGDVERSHDYGRKVLRRRRRKIGGENIIDSIGGFKVGDKWAELFLDFDSPNSNCCNRMGESDPLPLEYLVNGGDCGSGLFILVNGEWQLAGICSSVDKPSEYFNYGDIYGRYYGFTFSYLRIFAFKEWILENTL
jgi:hypothetical protein